MKKAKKANVLGKVALAVLAVAVLFAIVGLGNAIGAIKEEAIAETPEAILASVGVTEGKSVALPVAYYDQKMDDCVNLYEAGNRALLEARQFEWGECGYYNRGIEQGLMEYELGENYLPVATGGEMLANRGVVGDNFKRWFESVEGKSEAYAGIIKMDYRAAGAEFSFYKSEFYPLDGIEFSAGDKVNVDGHNHLFTMNFAVPFTVIASGEEYFEIAADDDTFVYVGDSIVIDMGGIHGVTAGRFMINEAGEVYAAVEDEELAYTGVTVQSGEGQLVRIFHADRDAGESAFNVRFVGMNLTVTNAEFAEAEGEGVQIAYNPADPSYVAPLGESSIFRPDNTKGLMVMATVLGVLVVVLSVFTMVMVRFVVRAKR